MAWCLQWNLKRNLYIFIEVNALEKLVWNMAAILSQPEWVIKSNLNYKSELGSFLVANLELFIV